MHRQLCVMTCGVDMKDFGGKLDEHYENAYEIYHGIRKRSGPNVLPLSQEDTWDEIPGEEDINGYPNE